MCLCFFITFLTYFWSLFANEMDASRKKKDFCRVLSLPGKNHLFLSKNQSSFVWDFIICLLWWKVTSQFILGGKHLYRKTESLIVEITYLINTDSKKIRINLFPKLKFTKTVAIEPCKGLFGTNNSIMDQIRFVEDFVSFKMSPNILIDILKAYVL